MTSFVFIFLGNSHCVFEEDDLGSFVKANLFCLGKIFTGLWHCVFSALCSATRRGPRHGGNRFERQALRLFPRDVAPVWVIDGEGLERQALENGVVSPILWGAGLENALSSVQCYSFLFKIISVVGISVCLWHCVFSTLFSATYCGSCLRW